MIGHPLIRFTSTRWRAFGDSPRSSAKGGKTYEPENANRGTGSPFDARHGRIHASLLGSADHRIIPNSRRAVGCRHGAGVLVTTNRFHALPLARRNNRRGQSEIMKISGMDINKMLAELKAEREQVEEAILALERLAAGRGRRRGRPPQWMSAARSQAPTDSAKRTREFSAATRKKMAEAQRRRWAAVRQSEGSQAS